MNELAPDLSAQLAPALDSKLDLSESAGGKWLSPGGQRSDQGFEAWIVPHEQNPRRRIRRRLPEDIENFRGLG